MQFYVDRIENDDVVVCVDENENIIEIKMEKIEGNVKEGSVLKRSGKKYIVNEIETKLKKKEMFELQEDLFNS